MKHRILIQMLRIAADRLEKEEQVEQETPTKSVNKPMTSQDAPDLDKIGDLFASLVYKPEAMTFSDVINQEQEIERRKEKETIPEAGAQSFAVVNYQVMKYTVIGADNIHHAQMKATKLFTTGWDTVVKMRSNEYYQLPSGISFLPVKQFNQLLALLRTP